MSLPPRTVGDELLDEIRKISEAMVSLKQRGMPEAVIVLWIQKKTRMNRRDFPRLFSSIMQHSRTKL